MSVRLVFGAGYLGGRVARRWQARGHTVYVVTRSPQHAEAFAAANFRPLLADVTQPATLYNLPAAECVLYAVGFDRQRYNSMRRVYVDGLRNVLDALPAGTQRLIYISSTSVYGQSAGQTVDEASLCEPASPGGAVCLEAEQTLAAHRLGRQAVILRMAGLYGPGRLPLAERLQRGEPIPADAHGLINLIHVEDAADVVLAAEAAALPSLYVVADGAPVLRRDFYTELSRVLGCPPPKFADPDPPTGRRGAGNKRVSNARLLAELPVRLRYPSYRQGLAALAPQTAEPG